MKTSTTKAADHKKRPPTVVPTKRTEHEAEIIDTLDELLDEIDRSLEENAWVHRFIQRGGQ